MVYMHETQRLVAGALTMHFLTDNVVVINKDDLLYKVINKNNLKSEQQVSKDTILAVVLEDIVDKCNEEIDREEIWKFILERGSKNNE